MINNWKKEKWINQYFRFGTCYKCKVKVFYDDKFDHSFWVDGNYDMFDIEEEQKRIKHIDNGSYIFEHEIEIIDTHLKQFKID